jgi:hypothetical protein
MTVRPVTLARLAGPYPRAHGRRCVDPSQPRNYELQTGAAVSKPILCLDFDGVIHSYTSGWKGARSIPDAPVPGALDFVSAALAAGWDVVIHSSRARYWGGITAMRAWLRVHAGNQWDCMGPSLCDVRFTRWKPSALVTIDDRALTFTGEWPELSTLRKFRPWNKK